MSRSPHRERHQGATQSFPGPAPGNVEAMILQVRLHAQQPNQCRPETRQHPTVRRMWTHVSHFLHTRAASSSGGSKANSAMPATSCPASPATTLATTWSSNQL
jgi:hypothetical protein